MADASTDLLVVGAGAVGLALARKAAMDGRDVILVEANESFGMETSSRNSEVIHAGIYYQKDSLKAQLCVKGAHALYAFCESRGITTRNYGKLIVATDQEQCQYLEDLKAKGEVNQVPGLEILSGKALAEKEPDHLFPWDQGLILFNPANVYATLRTHSFCHRNIFYYLPYRRVFVVQYQKVGDVFNLAVKPPNPGDTFRE